MKFENTKVYGFENAIIGMRLPMCKDFTEAKRKVNSDTDDCKPQILHEDDLDLMKRLIKADENSSGQPNSKFLRMIHVQVAITAPLYLWKEISTYKIATVTNSTSTMHKLTNYPITKNCFEMDDYNNDVGISLTEETYDIDGAWNSLIAVCESLRQKFNETKDKKYWKELIRILPESWLQTRMFDCNYATLRNIYAQRCKRPHKLTEWHTFCDWIQTLPYSKELLTDGDAKK